MLRNVCDFEARIHVLAEHLGNPALGTEAAGGIVGNQGVDDLPVTGVTLLFRRYQHLVIDPLVVGMPQSLDQRLVVFRDIP